MSGADLVDPNGELWYTRHQASLDPELVQREARLRHAVSRDVAAACVDARQAKEWTVNSGRSISARRLGALSSPRNPPVPEWPELEPAEATAARLQSGAAEARRQERRQERQAAKREEVRRWREARDAERAARPVDGRSRQQRSPRAQRALQEAGRRGVAEFAERKIAAAEHQKELPRYGQWVVREKPKRREVRVADAGGGGGAGVAGRQTKLVLTAEEKLERQTKQIGKIVRDAVASNRSLGGKALESIEGVFKAIDKDGSGDLDHKEFEQAMSRLGLGLTEQQIVQCIQVLDKDGDGEVSLSEFMSLVKEPQVKKGGGE